MQEILASHHPLQTDYKFQEFGYNFLEKNKNKKNKCFIDFERIFLSQARLLEIPHKHFVWAALI